MLALASGDTGGRVELDLLEFEVAPTLDKDGVCIAALVVQADRGLAALPSARKVVAGGLAALSALKISGLSY